MTYPTYFDYFPNNKYTLTVNKAGKPSYFNVKDFFHRMKVKDEILSSSTLYYSYNIINGKRPEQISYERYGDEQYYWVILQINNIVDYYNEWPLSYTELQEYLLKKYGSWENIEGVHHYETVETTDDDGNVLLPAGLVVSKDYEFKVSQINEDGVLVEYISRPIEVTNSTYEERINSKKSEILLLNDKYISDYVREVRNYATKLEPQESSVDISDYFR